MSRPVPYEVLVWHDRYAAAYLLLLHLTEAERLRCLIRHARACGAGCSYIEYDPDEVDVAPSPDCAVGAGLADALSDLRRRRCAHCGELEGLQDFHEVINRLPLCPRCGQRHSDAIEAHRMVTLSVVISGVLIPRGPP